MNTVYRERLLIYHGGLAFTNYVSILRFGTICAAAFGLVIMAPAYYTYETSPWWITPLSTNSLLLIMWMTIDTVSSCRWHYCPVFLGEFRCASFCSVDIFDIAFICSTISSGCSGVFSQSSARCAVANLLHESYSSGWPGRSQSC